MFLQISLCKSHEKSFTFSLNIISQNFKVFPKYAPLSRGVCVCIDNILDRLQLFLCTCTYDIISVSLNSIVSGANLSIFEPLIELARISMHNSP